VGGRGFSTSILHQCGCQYAEFCTDTFQNLYFCVLVQFGSPDKTITIAVILILVTCK
jgi:hypothetical protein